MRPTPGLDMTRLSLGQLIDLSCLLEMADLSAITHIPCLHTFCAPLQPRLSINMAFDWLPRLPPDSSRLAFVALGASVATLVATEAYRTTSTRQRIKKIKEAENDVYNSLQHQYPPGAILDVEGGVRRPVGGEVQQPAAAENIGSSMYNETLIREQLSRNYSFFGEKGMNKVRKGRVVIVGCGGVGSWAAVMLIRSGVSNIRLIDFDMVTLSSLNRHAIATLADVGTSKVVACKRFLERVAPWANIETRMELWQAGTQGERLIGDDVDWVIDAIDNITTKVDLLKYCHSKGIKVFASMGAGAKSDPTRVQIGDISNTSDDPLARSVRRLLRKQGITEGIPVVYSTEIPGEVKLLPLPEDEFQKGAIHELGPFDNFRVRILPVLGPLPSIFGLHVATYIICSLAEKPILNPLSIRNRKKLYDKLLRDLAARDAKTYGNGELTERLPIDESDVSFIFEELNRNGRSSIPPHSVPSRALLARWDATKPLAVDNCVVLSTEDVKRLDGAGGMGIDVKEWSEGTKGGEANEAVERRREEARKWLEVMNR
ncbi:hypothetical protein FRB95_005385 [Tulasnella sp. JGI-2019a]|nr:hypothetical protein FRB95_005385 [Tulasnella sp. JGI-2019a]